MSWEGAGESFARQSRRRLAPYRQTPGPVVAAAASNGDQRQVWLSSTMPVPRSRRAALSPDGHSAHPGAIACPARQAVGIDTNT